MSDKKVEKPKKRDEYNTISFKILIKDMLHECSSKKLKLEKLLEKIENIDEKYNEFRDKFYAHIELNENDTLKSVKDLGITYEDITYLLKLSEEVYDELLLLLDRASSDNMKDDIENLSGKLWDAYEKSGLVKRTS